MRIAFIIAFDSSTSGARQESDRSCGPPFRSAFPEVLKATTKLRTTESDDGVGAVNGPVHSGAFESRADGDLASGLHNARGSAQALGVELRVAHTLLVGLEIVKAAARLVGAGDLASDGGELRPESSGVEFFLSAFRPACSARVGRAVWSFSEIAQALLGMKAVDDLGGIRKLPARHKFPANQHRDAFRLSLSSGGLQVEPAPDANVIF